MEHVVAQLDFAAAETLSEKMKVLTDFCDGNSCEDPGFGVPATVYDCWSSYFRQQLEQDCTENVPEQYRSLLSAVEKGQESLAGCTAIFPAAKENEAPLSYFTTVISAALEDHVTVAALEEAIEFLEADARCVRLKQGLQQGGLGIQLLEDANKQRQQGELDSDLYDQWCDALSKLFAQEVVEEVKPDDDDSAGVPCKWKLEFAALMPTKDGSIAMTRMASEAVDLMRPVLLQWSKKQFESEASAIADSLAQLRDSCLAVDIVLSIAMQESLEPFVAGAKGSFEVVESVAAKAEWPPGELAASLLEPVGRLDESMVLEVASELEEFLDKVVEPRAEGCKTVLDAIASLRATLDDSLKNNNLRGKYHEQCELLKTMLRQTFPEDLDAAWLECSRGGGGFFGQVLALARQLDSTTKFGDFGFGNIGITAVDRSIAATGESESTTRAAKLVDVTKIFIVNCVCTLGKKLVDVVMLPNASGAVAALDKELTTYLTETVLGAESWSAVEDSAPSSRLTQLMGVEASAEVEEPWSERAGEKLADITMGLPAMKLLTSVLNVDKIAQYSSVTTSVSTSGACPRDKFLAVFPLYADVVVAMQVGLLVSKLTASSAVKEVEIEAGEQKTRTLHVHEWLVAGVQHLQKFVDQKAAVRQKLDDANFLTSKFPEPVIMNFYNELSVWLRALKKEIIETIVENIKVEAESLKTCTPRYEHCVNSSRYTATLAKKNLLDHARNAKLAEAINRVRGLLQSGGQMHTAFATEVPAWTDAVEAAESHLSHGQETMTVIAAVNVVEMMKANEDARSMAETILAKHNGVLKGPWKTRLEGVAKAKQ